MKLVSTTWFLFQIQSSISFTGFMPSTHYSLWARRLPYAVFPIPWNFQLLKIHQMLLPYSSGSPLYPGGLRVVLNDCKSEL